MISDRQSVRWSKKWVWSSHFLSGIQVQLKEMSCVSLNWKRSARLYLIQHHNLHLLNLQIHTLNLPRPSPLVHLPLLVARLVHQMPPQVHPDNIIERLNINTIKYKNGLQNLIKKEIYGNWRVRSVYGRCECFFFFFQFYLFVRVIKSTSLVLNVIHRTRSVLWLLKKRMIIIQRMGFRLVMARFLLDLGKGNGGG